MLEFSLFTNLLLLIVLSEGIIPGLGWRHRPRGGGGGRLQRPEGKRTAVNQQQKSQFTVQQGAERMLSARQTPVTDNTKASDAATGRASAVKLEGISLRSVARQLPQQDVVLLHQPRFRLDGLEVIPEAHGFAIQSPDRQCLHKASLNGKAENLCMGVQVHQHTLPGILGSHRVRLPVDLHGAAAVDTPPVNLSLHALQPAVRIHFTGQLRQQREFGEGGGRRTVLASPPLVRPLVVVVTREILQQRQRFRRRIGELAGEPLVLEGSKTLPLSTLGLFQIADFFNNVRFIADEYNATFGVPHVIIARNESVSNVSVEPVRRYIEPLR
jgi:hypothetical protein